MVCVQQASLIFSTNVMFLFVSPIILGGPPHPAQSLGSKRTCRVRPARKEKPLSRGAEPARIGPHASQARQDYASGSDTNESSSSDWQEDLRLLLDPTLNTSARQVLLQDMAKRVPDAMSDLLKTPGLCRNSEGLADVVRQLTNDVLPDLLANGPTYIAKAVNNAAAAASSGANPASSNSTGAGPFSPPSFSLDDVGREFRNVFNRTPEGLFTPEFRVLLSAENYQIRQYPGLIIAETKMRPDVDSSVITEGMGEVESAAAMGRSFNNLAGYLFGGNIDRKEMKMTTPVMLNKNKSDPSEGKMSFIIGEYSSLEDVPKTNNDEITLREQLGGIYAVCEFSGFVTQGEATRQREKLLSRLSSDSIEVTEAGKEAYKCMIYNGPSTLPNLRRNELMIEVVYDNNNNEDVNDEQS